MKMVKCKNCETQYSQQITQSCPKCGCMVIAKKSTAKSIIIIACIFVAIFIIAGISNVLNNENSSTPLSGDTSTGTSINNAPSEKDTEEVIYSDSNIKVSYIKLSEASDYGANMTACYIHLKVENVGTQTVKVSLIDAYVNDSAIAVMSGLPMELAPGKNSQAPFVFGYDDIVNSVDDIEKLEFKIALYDENYSNLILETENIVINP